MTKAKWPWKVLSDHLNADPTKRLKSSTILSLVNPTEVYHVSAVWPILVKSLGDKAVDTPDIIIPCEVNV